MTFEQPGEASIMVPAGTIEIGDKIFSKSMIPLGTKWLTVRRTQLLGDGSIKVGTEFSEIRMSGGINTLVRKGLGRAEPRSKRFK